MKSDVQDASNVRAVVAQALIHNHDQVKAREAIAAVLGESVEVAKNLVFAYLYDATNETLLQILREQHKAPSKRWRVTWRSGYRDQRVGRLFTTLREAEAFANVKAMREVSTMIERVV